MRIVSKVELVLVISRRDGLDWLNFFKLSLWSFLFLF